MRVYVRSGLLGNNQTPTGEVVVEGCTGALLGDWTQVGILTPQAPGSVTSQRKRAYVTERRRPALITARSSCADAAGTARAEVTLRTPDPTETDPRQLRSAPAPTMTGRRAVRRRPDRS